MPALPRLRTTIVHSTQTLKPRCSAKIEKTRFFGRSAARSAPRRPRRRVPVRSSARAGATPPVPAPSSVDMVTECSLRAVRRTGQAVRMGWTVFPRPVRAVIPCGWVVKSPGVAASASVGAPRSRLEIATHCPYCAMQCGMELVTRGRRSRGGRTRRSAVPEGLDGGRPARPPRPADHAAGARDARGPLRRPRWDEALDRGRRRAAGDRSARTAATRSACSAAAG